MKLVLLSLLFSGLSLANPTVLVSYFDAYGGAKANNSETVARLLLAKSRGMGLPFEIRLCRVQTKFDVSFAELRECLNTLPEKPVLVLGLGETGCDLKIEIMARNLDKTFGADNAGVERKNTPIVKGAPAAVGLTYPLAEMFCALGNDDQKSTIISNNAGSFVCNNLAFQTVWFESQLHYGFMHVPDHSCRNLAVKNDRIALALITMLNRGVEAVLENPAVRSLPVMKSEFDARRSDGASEECERNFWKAARAFDEKKRWF